MARGDAVRATARRAPSTRTLVLALTLLVTLTTLCVKSLAPTGTAGSSPRIVSAADLAPDTAAPDTAAPDTAAPDTAAPDEAAPGDTLGCKDRPPATGVHSAPQPADAATSQPVPAQAPPRPARAVEIAEYRSGPAPPAPRHILLSVLRI